MTINFQNNGVLGSFDSDSKTLILNSQRLAFVPTWYNNPGKLYIIFSTECNLRCIYCFQNKMKKKSSDIDIKQIHKYIHYLQNDVQEIVLFGGEPFIMSNYGIITSIFENFDYLKISAFTNGNFDLSYRDLLNQYRYTISGITISLDGPKEVHDHRRVNPIKSSYDAIIDNLAALLKLEKKINISINVDMSNIYLLEKLLDDVIIKNGFGKYKYILNPVKYVKNEVDSILLIDIYFNLKKKYGDNIYINNRLVNNLTNLFNNRALMKDRCGLNSTYVLDLPNNKIFACPQNENTSLGIISDGKLLIDKSGISDYVDKISYMSYECEKCNYSYICPYGCPFSANDKDCKLNVEKMLLIALNHFDLLK